MRWEKIKNIFCPNGHFDWMNSHASNPFAEYIENGVYRVYFTCRDSCNRSHIGFVDVNFDEEFKIVNISNEPVLQPGELGLFDDSGVAMGCILNFKGRKFLYYLGWNLKVTVPWMNTIGIAEYDFINKKFVKCSLVPVMDRSDEDPYSISYPFILEENDILTMWYGSNTKWGSDQSEMNHVIKIAHSFDAKNWFRSNKIAVNLKYENEYALSKPFVLKEKNIYKMWYSYRGNKHINTYRIGYAESLNGIEWERKDDIAGIDISKYGWDSVSIEYPYILDYKNKRYMLYNGDNYGETGFGIAVLKDN